MMQHNRIFVILTCAILFSAQTALQAQPALPRYAVSLEPLYLYNGGLRLNMEKRLKVNNWIELNLTGYYLPHYERETSRQEGYYTSNSNFEYILGLSGLGIGGIYKHYFFRSFFVSGGVSYTHYRVRYADLDWYNYQEDGLNLYEYQYQDVGQTFDKFTTGIYIGGRSAFRHKLFIEYYFGLGYAHSLYNKNKETYSLTPFGFGYKGIHPTTGIKIGFNIR